MRKTVSKWNCHPLSYSPLTWQLNPDYSRFCQKWVSFKVHSSTTQLRPCIDCQLFLKLNLCFHFGFEIEKSTTVGASPSQTVARVEKWLGCVCPLRNSIREAFLVIMPPQIFLFAFWQHQAFQFAVSVLDILVPVFVQINSSDWLNQTRWRKIPQ